MQPIYESVHFPGHPPYNDSINKSLQQHYNESNRWRNATDGDSLKDCRMKSEPNANWEYGILLDYDQNNKTYRCENYAKGKSLYLYCQTPKDTL